MHYILIAVGMIGLFIHTRKRLIHQSFLNTDTNMYVKVYKKGIIKPRGLVVQTIFKDEPTVFITEEFTKAFLIYMNILIQYSKNKEKEHAQD